jgi:hypothetical protein
MYIYVYIYIHTYIYIYIYMYMEEAPAAESVPTLPENPQFGELCAFLVLWGPVD